MAVQHYTSTSKWRNDFLQSSLAKSFIGVFHFHHSDKSNMLPKSCFDFNILIAKYFEQCLKFLSVNLDSSIEKSLINSVSHF